MSHPSLDFTLLPDEPETPATTAALSAAAYARMLKALLPPGRVWLLEPERTMSLVLLASADELARVEQRGLDLIEEADPRTTDELLEDFERVLGVTAEGTADERRARIVSKLIQRQRFRPVDIINAIAPLLGQEVADVVLWEQSHAFAVALGHEREIFRFFVYRDPTLPGTYDLAAAQALLDLMRPEHTMGHAIESLGMRCDDAYSLCDRDVLGA